MFPLILQISTSKLKLLCIILLQLTSVEKRKVSFSLLASRASLKTARVRRRVPPKLEVMSTELKFRSWSNIKL